MDLRDVFSWQIKTTSLEEISTHGIVLHRNIGIALRRRLKHPSNWVGGLGGSRRNILLYRASFRGYRQVISSDMPRVTWEIAFTPLRLSGFWQWCDGNYLRFFYIPRQPIAEVWLWKDTSFFRSNTYRSVYKPVITAYSQQLWSEGAQNECLL